MEQVTSSTQTMLSPKVTVWMNMTYAFSIHYTNNASCLTSVPPPHASYCGGPLSHVVPHNGVFSELNPPTPFFPGHSFLVVGRASHTLQSQWGHAWLPARGVPECKYLPPNFDLWHSSLRTLTTWEDSPHTQSHPPNEGGDTTELATKHRKKTKNNDRAAQLSPLTACMHAS